MIDKDLFLHDLAVVAILKDEGHYLKEWLDYHLLAGVNHFYLYDNDSTDNQSEVAMPYVKAGLIDYILFPGKAMQYIAYNDAIKRFKFHCRYMAFIDGDEFIFPKTNRSVVEVVDEILSDNSNAGGLAINHQFFGSNGQEKADYSKGVLERFTRRAPSDSFWGNLNNIRGGNIFVKSIVNPRRVNYFSDPHHAVYLSPYKAINEVGTTIMGGINYPINADKIVVNHYYLKSLEEFMDKVNRGSACRFVNHKSMSFFEANDRNEVFDDGILKYCIARSEDFSFESDEYRINRLRKALIKTLSEAECSLETALTCRALSTYLREYFPNDNDFWKMCEEAALGTILNSLRRTSFLESLLFIKEFPRILKLTYPIVKEFRVAILQIIPQVMEIMRSRDHMWREIAELDYIQDILRSDSFDGRKNF